MSAKRHDEAGEAITLRLAYLDDVDALNELIPLSARALSAGFYTPKQIDAAVAHVFGVDRQLIVDQTYFVAETDDGRIVGCGGWSKRKTMFGGDATGFKESDDALLQPGVDPARIRAFFVHPAFARRGIGRRIIAECEAAARAAGFDRMELVATLPGVPLYAAMGYAEIEPMDIGVAGHVSIPAVRMGKTL